MAKKLTSMEFNEETLKMFKEFAKQHDMTFTTLVKLAVKEYIERHK